MKIAIGLKAHSGWAALVALSLRDGAVEVSDRRRIELVESGADWARQPYHAAEALRPPKASDLVARGVEMARRIALREMKGAARRAHEAGHAIVACGVLVGEPMPEWSVDEILAVHFRMHKAEGVLFRDVLLRAATTCGLRVVPLIEKQLPRHAAQTLGRSSAPLIGSIAALGRRVGPPWGKDQKDAALAAVIAFEEATRR